MSALAGEVESRDSVAAKVGGLAEAILVEATESTDPSLQRSAAEMNAFAACIGSDSYALNLVKSLCRAMAETSSAPRCSSISSAVAIHICVIAVPGSVQFSRHFVGIAFIFVFCSSWNSVQYNKEELFSFPFFSPFYNQGNAASEYD